MTTCNYCNRAIELDGGLWVDPEATEDDITWRETCDANDTFTAPHEPGESKPQHLSAEFWAKCKDIRGYLMTILNGLVLGVGIREPESETDPELMLFLAPTEAASGVVSYEWATARFIVSDTLHFSNVADFYTVIHTEKRPANQVSELLRAAVSMISLTE